MLTLQKSNAIVEAILKKGREMNLRPLCVVVTDIGAKIKAAQREDGCSQARIEMALGKGSQPAHGLSGHQHGEGESTGDQVVDPGEGRQGIRRVEDGQQG